MILEFVFDKPLFLLQKDDSQSIFLMDDCGNIGWTNDIAEAMPFDSILECGPLITEAIETVHKEQISVKQIIFR